MVAARSCRCAVAQGPPGRGPQSLRGSAAKEKRAPSAQGPELTSVPTQGQRCPSDPAETLHTLHFDTEQPGFVPRRRTGANLGDGGRAGAGSRKTSALLRLLWVLSL